MRPTAWQPFVAGQHLDFRLTAPDGYQAERSYSVCSPPEWQGSYEVAVELMPDGEVSPYFHEVARPGDSFEIRGPFGGHFVWTADRGGPLTVVFEPMGSTCEVPAGGHLTVCFKGLPGDRGAVDHRPDYVSVCAPSSGTMTARTATGAEIDLLSGSPEDA